MPEKDAIHARPGMLLTAVPFAAALKMAVLEIAGPRVIAKVPYDAKLVGNPETGVIHGGVITALLDNACGIAVAGATGMPGTFATLDLRIDYMKPATPGEDIFAFAECYKVTRNIAFARGTAYQGDRDDPIATCAAAFMLATKSALGANLAPKRAAP